MSFFPTKGELMETMKIWQAIGRPTCVEEGKSDIVFDYE